jgi:predicted CoA-binding protein
MQPLNSLKENDTLAALLDESKTVAIVGLSPKEQRPSNMVGRYLIDNCYTVYPVNPGQTEILGLVCYSDVTSLPGRVDIIDIFRKSQDVLPVVEEIVKMPNLPRAIWMQQGIVNEEAAVLARSHGILVIMDRCIKVDHQNLIK